VEEGFALVTINGGDFDWKYLDYGWEIKNEEDSGFIC